MRQGGLSVIGGLGARPLSVLVALGCALLALVAVVQAQAPPAGAAPKEPPGPSEQGEWARGQAQKAREAASANRTAEFVAAGFGGEVAEEMAAAWRSAESAYLVGAEAIAAAMAVGEEPIEPVEPPASEKQAEVIRQEAAALRQRIAAGDQQIRFASRDLERAREALEAASRAARRADEAAATAPPDQRARTAVLAESAAAALESASASAFAQAWELHRDEAEKRRNTERLAVLEKALSASGHDSLFVAERAGAATARLRRALDEATKSLDAARGEAGELAARAARLREAGDERAATVAETADLAERLARGEEAMRDGVARMIGSWEAIADATARPSDVAAVAGIRDRAVDFSAELADRKAQIESAMRETAARRRALDAEQPAREPGLRKAQEDRSAMLDRRSASLQRAAAMLEEALDLERQIAAESRARLAAASLGERTAQAGEHVAGWLAGLWDAEIFHFAENVTGPGGVVVRRERPVTLGKFATALVGAVVGMVLAAWLTRGLAGAASRRFAWNAGAAQVVQRMLFFGAAAAILLSLLHWLHIPLTAFAFLGGAIAIGFGFGVQAILNNFISGLILTAERRVRVGDVIELDGQSGRVMSLGTRCSTIRRFDGVEVLVPNSCLLEKTVANSTLSDHRLRQDIRLVVSHRASPEVCIDLLESAARAAEGVLPEPAPVAFFEDFAEAGFRFGLYYWVDLRGEDPRAIATSIRLAVEARARSAGIELASTASDLLLRSGRSVEKSVAGKPGPLL